MMMVIIIIRRKRRKKEEEKNKNEEEEKRKIRIRRRGSKLIQILCFWTSILPFLSRHHPVFYLKITFWRLGSVSIFR
jgi:hypothetical protein